MSRRSRPRRPAGGANATPTRNARSAARRPAPPARRGLPAWWIYAGVGTIAVIVVAVVVALGQPGLAPSTAAAGLPTEGRSKGSATAPLVIEEWADYQCPACRMLALDAMPAINDLIAAGQVRVEYRYKTFLGQESVWAAAAAECANEQGRFWEFNQRLYQEQRARNQGRFSRDNLKQYGAAVGLDSAPFNACVDSGRYEAAVRAENDRGAQLGVSSTPTLFLNGQPLSGAPTGPQLREIVTRLLNS